MLFCVFPSDIFVFTCNLQNEDHALWLKKNISSQTRCKKTGLTPTVTELVFGCLLE